jgi:hypothetical protein
MLRVSFCRPAAAIAEQHSRAARLSAQRNQIVADATTHTPHICMQSGVIEVIT